MCPQIGLSLSVLSRQQCATIKTFLEENPVLPSSARTLATALLDNALPLLRAHPQASGLEGTVLELAVHAAAVLLSGHHAVLEPLRMLAFSPSNMAVRL